MSPFSFPVFDFLNAGSTGIFVTVVIALKSFFSDRRNAKKRATVDEYLEWLRRQEHKHLLEGQQQLLQGLLAHDEGARLLREALERLMAQVEASCSTLTDIAQKVSGLPEMQRKIDLLTTKLASGKEDAGLAKGQIAVSARVLEALAAGGKGAGGRVVMKHEGNHPREGTLALRWILGTRSPHMMLADYVGDTRANRLSLILRADASVSLRAFNRDGTEYTLESPSYHDAESITPVAAWKNRDVSLWVNGRCHGRQTMQAPFLYLGPILLWGIDIEGILSAHRAAWLDFPRGIAFEKDGISHGAYLEMVNLWGVEHESQLISDFWHDPWAMFRMRASNKAFFEEGIRKCTAKIQERPDADGYLERAQFYARTGDSARAVKDYTEALRFRRHPLLYTYRGEARQTLGRFLEALADYDSAIELNARMAAPLNGRAWLLATCPDPSIRDGAKAIADAKRACALSSDHRDSLEALAAAYAEAGDFDAAVQSQERALSLYPVCSVHGCSAEIAAARERLSLYGQHLPYREKSDV